MEYSWIDLVHGKMCLQCKDRYACGERDDGGCKTYNDALTKSQARLKYSIVSRLYAVGRGWSEWSNPNETWRKFETEEEAKVCLKMELRQHNDSIEYKIVPLRDKGT